MEREHRIAGISGAESTCALSPIQRRFWNDYARVPNANWANIFGILPFHGEVDMAALQRALGVLLLRHDSLRTAFPIVSGVPVQRVTRNLEVPIAVTDTRGLPAERQALVFEQARSHELSRPFELDVPPLMRAHLVRFDARAELILTWHHLVVDGYSRLVLLRELRKVYASCLAQELTEALPPAKPYMVYAREANEQQASGALVASREHWAAALAPPLPASPFASLAQAPATGSNVSPERPAATFKLVMPQDLAISMKQQGWRGFTAMMAAFCLVGHRFQETPDLIVGTPLNGRNEQQRDLVGLLINLVMLRMTLNAGDTYTAYVRRLRETLHSAKEHQNYQLDELVTDLKLGLNSFDITRTFFSAIESDLPVPAALRAVGSHSEELPNAVRFDTMWYAIRHTDGIVMDCRYSKSVFSEGVIRDLAERFLDTLLQLLRDPRSQVPWALQRAS